MAPAAEAAPPACERCGRERVWRADPRRKDGGTWRCPARSHGSAKAHRADASHEGLVKTTRLKRKQRPVATLAPYSDRATYFYWT